MNISAKNVYGFISNFCLYYVYYVKFDIWSLIYDLIND